jgi:hypothetical protein
MLKRVYNGSSSEKSREIRGSPMVAELPCGFQEGGQSECVIVASPWGRSIRILRQGLLI